MKILIVGGGGREHALAWKAAQSTQVETVYVAPGNAGTVTENKITNIEINAEDIDALKIFAEKESVDLTIVGPEAPLVAGIVDEFQKAELLCFGPTKAAAILEGSKSFSKDFLKKYKIPTAEYEIFTEESAAVNYVKSKKMPIVIKADGLAAGKGVVVATSENEAIETINQMLSGNKFGDAGHRIVIEEFLEGEEVSFIVISDGKNVLPLATSQDHKARDDGDNGPNTGGMGAICPAPGVGSAEIEEIRQRVLQPVVDGMRAEGMPFVGVLYAGLMWTEKGPKVLEFNARWGDPETQVYLMRLNTDLVDLFEACIDRRLAEMDVSWKTEAAVCVVMASGGYPGSYPKGILIEGIEDADALEGVKVFHAGTQLVDGEIVTSGGRVLGVTAVGADRTAARDQAYAAVEQIKFEGAHVRRDIAVKALQA